MTLAHVRTRGRDGRRLPEPEPVRPDGGAELLAMARVFELIRNDRALNWRVFRLRAGTDAGRAPSSWAEVLAAIERL